MEIDIKHTLFLLIISLCSSTVIAQLPITNLYMLEFVENNGTIKVDKASLLTNFNNKGYNNQPSFFKPNKVYFTSNVGDEQFSNIVILDLDKNKYQFFTKTDSISEFSPTLMPDRKNISVIRQEGKDQWLWRYPLDRANGGGPILNTIQDVGYHCWLDEENVALFRVTEPISLSIADVTTGQISDKLNDIGRCLKKDQDGNLNFVHKITSDFWYLKKYDPKSSKITVVSEIDVEDFEILPSGTYLKASGTNLYKMSAKDENWELCADLAYLGISNISRITTSRNKLIIVAN